MNFNSSFNENFNLLRTRSSYNEGILMAHTLSVKFAKVSLSFSSIKVIVILLAKVLTKVFFIAMSIRNVLGE